MDKIPIFEDELEKSIINTNRCEDIVRYVDNLNDYYERSEKYLKDEGEKFTIVGDELIGRCQFSNCGRGSFKFAYKMINGKSWVFKIIQQNIKDYDLNPKMRTLITVNETVLQQMACVIFYEMKTKLNNLLSINERIKNEISKTNILSIKY